MPHKKSHPKPAAPLSASAFEQAWTDPRAPQTPPMPPPTVSGRWLLAAVAIAVPASALCAWAALCLLFWQGSWQLLYHPTSAVTRTPASISLPFDPIGFAAKDSGEPQLRGWWIPADPHGRFNRYTVLYLHGQDGNLGDTIDAVAALHNLGVQILAFDYRGYGQSRFARPSEARWREDAESALHYLTETRHIDPRTIVLDGSNLGANLALEAAAAHPELAGVVLESPLEAPVNAIFRDSRARLVPAHLLVRDRFDLNAPATALRIPSMWIYQTFPHGILGPPEKPATFQAVRAPKMLVWLTSAQDPKLDAANAITRWLEDLPNSGRNLPPCQFADGLTC